MLSSSSSSSWTDLPDLPRAPSYPYVVSVDQSIFILHDDSRVVYEFDFTNGAWQSKAQMPEVCNEYSAAVFFDHKIWVLGRREGCVCFMKSPLTHGIKSRSALGFGIKSRSALGFGISMGQQQ